MIPPAAAATGRTLPRTVAPRAPRRTSGPAAAPRRGGDGSARRRAAAPSRDPFIIRAIERTMRMADSRFLDRLIRGRLWIPLVAMGLMGIVFMQVSMLKLNAGIGRAVQASSTLERQNAKMRAELSGAESGSKILSTAKQVGMVAPAASTTPSYVKVGSADQAASAARHMTPADPDAVARTKAAAQRASAGAANPTIGAAVTGAATGTTGTTPGATTTAGTGTTTGAATGTATTAATTTGAGTTPAGTGAATGAGTTTGTGTATGTGATTGAATTGTTTGAPTATGIATGAATTGAATAAPPTQQPQQSTTSGGAVAPTAG